MPSPGPLEYILVIGAIVFVVVVSYALIVGVARGLHRFMPATTPPRDPAMDALRTRLATGEIDDVEFQRLRSVLQGP
jgi:uncharacterized membrane protein